MDVWEAADREEREQGIKRRQSVSLLDLSSLIKLLYSCFTTIVGYTHPFEHSSLISTTASLISTTAVVIMSTLPQSPNYSLPIPTKLPTSYYPSTTYNYKTQSYLTPAYPQQATYSRISSSPPERAESTSTSGASYSVSNSSYAGSASDSDSPPTSIAGIDLLDYMHDRLSNTIDPIPLDRNLVQQAQT